ncbi:energy-coupling factor ABC transporter ATP-binding protein [Desulfosporosinus metallidurans]|uniref:ABC transporter domain-containing protein n=1 Tax=Desulfosporosinus metallidurans TaxID=1888891 RepID=A0A1Q8QMK7_9FIRM|nr:ATP-binding cassette domain-containing protein [Desulfosporosinus metallidurans]OLN28570.1 hypothetical protein DSOL_3948 [Desulfosporosinus metallidurans]
MAKIIETIQLNHTYTDGTQALKSIDLCIEEGEKIAIVGQNGSGKTTLSKHFNGLLRPTCGQVLVNGRDICNTSTGELSSFIGYVFQNPSYQLFSRSVQEEIKFGLKNIGLKGNELTKRIVETMDYFDLSKDRERQPLSFSSGVRKLIALASVYAMRPQLLILDEPTTGQDHLGKEKVGMLLQKLANAGHTYIVITHDMNFVAKFATRVIVMAKGEIIQDGSPAKLFTNTKVMQKAHLHPPQVFSLAQRLAIANDKQNDLDPPKMAKLLVTEGMVS